MTDVPASVSMSGQPYPDDAPPGAPRHITISRHHGIELQDAYAWLRADNWQEVMRDPSRLPPDIRAYLEAENAYSNRMMGDTLALQSKLFEEMKGRIKEDDSSVPAPDGPFEYMTRFVTGGQYPLLCRRARGSSGDGNILLDGDTEAKGKAYWHLGGVHHSPDHRLLAYAVDEAGSEFYTLRFRDIEGGRDLEDAIPSVSGSFAWYKDSATILYVRLDDHHRSRWVFRHRLGTPVAEDTLVYEEQDPGLFTSVGATQSGDYIIIDTHRHDLSESRIINASLAGSEPVLIAARREGHEYDVDHWADQLVILTNSDGAEDFRICLAPLSDPSPPNWKELVPHKPGCLILDIAVYKGHLVRLEREDGLPRIVIRTLVAGAEPVGAEHAIAFDEAAYSLGLSSGYEFDTTTVRFSYSSMTTPSEVYDYDMATRERVLRKRQEVPSGHDPADYRTGRLYATAADGETVPVSFLHHRSTPLDGSAPVLLYGYGAYGIAIPASFSTTRLSLVDRGFIYCIAHVRGGKDKGYRWYTGGRREKKVNTFTDFIAAADHLVQQGLTRRGNIVAHGGSAGGMLMGAIANMAPELFLGIIADVPFVDVLNTMLDKDLPLTPPEWPEWGNPIESAKDFETIRAYSPYDNVTAKAYPHIYAHAGLTDPRVTYWEPAKWIAKLRELNSGSNLVLLKTNMEAGHGGASGRFESLRETALAYAFALKIAGRAEAVA